MKHLSTGSVRLSLLALCPLLLGCDTRREIFDDAGVWVQLEASWRQVGMRPEGVSIYIFAQETGKRVELLLTNEMRGDSVTVDSVKLHVGRYSVLALNETVVSHDDLSFREVGSYYGFEAYVRPAALPAGSGQALRKALPASAAAEAPDVLAAAHRDEFEVSYDMLSRKSACPPILLAAKKLNFVVEVTLHVKNLRYLEDNAPAAAVTNLSEGVFLAAETPSKVPIVQYFMLDRRAFAPNGIDGTLKGTFTTFGVADAAEKSALLMRFRLHDGAPYFVERDVTGKLPVLEASEGGGWTLELGTGKPGDPPIAIDSVPVDDASGIFEVDVGAWGSDTVVNVPVS